MKLAPDERSLFAMDDTDHYRCRLIYLGQSDDISNLADAACDVLGKIDGVLLAAAVDKHSIHLIYSLDSLSFELISDLLCELGFSLEDSILLNLRKSVFEFLDENARDHLHIDEHCSNEGEYRKHELPHLSEEKYWEDYH